MHDDPEIRALDHLGIDSDSRMYFGHTASLMDVGESTYVTVVWTENGDTEILAVVNVPHQAIDCTTIVRVER